MDRLQNKLIKARDSLRKKENKKEVLEKPCHKCNIVAREFEAAQYMLARLKEKNLLMIFDIAAAREKVKELGLKLEVTERELVQTKNKLSANPKDQEIWRGLHQTLLETLPDKSRLADPPLPSKIAATLKEVLRDYKHQIHKNYLLQGEITKRDQIVEIYKKQNLVHHAKLEEQKGIQQQLNSKLSALQAKVGMIGPNSYSEVLKKYKQQTETLKAKLQNVRQEMKKLDLRNQIIENQMMHTNILAKLKEQEKQKNEKLKNKKESQASIVQKTSLLKQRGKRRNEKPKSKKGSQASIVQKTNSAKLKEQEKQKNEKLKYKKSPQASIVQKTSLPKEQEKRKNEKPKSKKGSQASIVQKTNSVKLKEEEKHSTQIDVLKEIKELRTLYTQACSEQDSASIKLEDVRSKMQKEKNISKLQGTNHANQEKLKTLTYQIANIRSELIGLKKESERATMRISQLQKEFNVRQKEPTKKPNGK